MIESEILIQLVNTDHDQFDAASFWRELQKLGWIKSKATWTMKWWKAEEAFLAPWAVLNRDNMVLGQDYFWNLLDIASFVKAQNCDILINRPQFPFPAERMIVNYCSRKWTIQRRIQDIITSRSYESAKLLEMLEIAGWKIFVEEERYYTPWNTSEHFKSIEELVSYLVKIGAYPPEKNTSKMEISDCDTGNESDSLSTKENNFNNETSCSLATLEHRPKAKFFTPTSALNTTMESMESNSSMIDNSASLMAYHQVYEHVSNLMLSVKPNMFAIKTALVEECGWKVIYAPAQKTGYILAPWVPQEDNFALWRTGNTTGFQHLTDYFLDHNNDEKNLLAAFQSESFQKKCGDFIISLNQGKESAPKEISPFQLRNLSPQRPLHHAKDPSVHTDRLVPVTSALTPQIDSNDSEFIFDDDGFVFCDDGLILAEADPPSSSSSSSSESNNSTLYNLLCSSSVKFIEVYNELKSMEPPWTYVLSDPESHSHLEVNIEGSSRIYLRPLKKVSDRNMIFNEDYFYSEAALIRYLKFNYGIETLQNNPKEDLDDLQKRRPGRRSSRANEIDSVADSVRSAPPSAEKLTKSKKSDKAQKKVRNATITRPSNEVVDAIEILRSSVHRNLQIVKDYFRPLGWECISEKHSKLNNNVGGVGYTEYLVAPWAKEGITEESVNYSRIDREKFVENVDFFDIRNNREAFCNYLQANGFQRNANKRESSDRFERVAASKESLKKQHSKSKPKFLYDSKVTLSSEDSDDELQSFPQQSRYDVETDEYLLVQYLKETPPSFGKIKDVLKGLGWRLVYETTTKEERKVNQEVYISYFLAPSAKAREGGVVEIENKKNYVTIDHTILKKGIDYFRADEKETLYDFLKQNGYASVNIKKSKGSKSSRSTSVTASERPESSGKGAQQKVKKERPSLQIQPAIPSSLNPFEVDTDKYLLAQYLDESPPSFTKIKEVLYALGWRIVYETTTRDLQMVGKDYSSYFLTPSANEKEGGYKQSGSKKYNVTINRDVLKENVDFFDLEQKKSLYDYLLCNGFAMIKAAERNDSNKSPRSITASISPGHLSTSTASQKEAISDLIAKFPVESNESDILHRLLLNPEAQHSLIWDNLQSLGWFHVKESAEGTKYYVAPWARDLDKSLFDIHGGLAVLDREKLTEDDDFFDSAEVDKLYRYLVAFKFSRRRDTVSSSQLAVEVTKSAQTKPSKAAKKAAAPAAVAPNRHVKEEVQQSQRVKHLGVILSEGTPEYDIAVELSKTKPSPGLVWNRLMSLGWYLIYESYDDKYCIAPWVQHEILHREKTYKVIDKSKLVENVDYFRSDNLPQLYDYLRKHDFSEKVDSVSSSEPTFVSQEISRLQSLGLRASTAVAKQSQSQSHPSIEKLPMKVVNQPSPCGSTQSHGSDDYVYDQDSVNYFANSSSSEKDRSVKTSQDSSPSQKSSDSKNSNVAGNYTHDSDEYLALECLKEEPVYYPKVWRFLSDLGWSTNYEKGREDCYYVAPWAWDGITRGVSKYIVIDRSKVSEKVDYFLDRESMYEHIRTIGFRRTLQDEVYVHPEPVRVTAVKRKAPPTHDSSSDDRNRNTADSSDEGGPVQVKAVVGKNKKRRQPTATESAVEVPPSPVVVPKTWTLRESIEQVYPSIFSTLTSSVGSEHSSSGSSPIQKRDRALVNTVISRDAEKEELTSIIKGALAKAEGCSVYLCGNPGTGKTLTANSVIQSLYSSSMIQESTGTSTSSHEDERRGFRVLTLVGTTFATSADVFREIAKLLGKLRHGDSDEVAKRTVVDHFRTQARRVRFSNCSHVSSPTSQDSGDEASVSVGSKKKRSSADSEGKVLMTILLLDEIDLCKKEAMRELLLLTNSTSSSFPSEQLSDGDDERSEKSAKNNREDEASSYRESNGQKRARYSSLILVGIGNVINWHESLQLPHYCIVKKIIFRVYNNDAMMAIVNHYTRNLLYASAAGMLIARILNYKNGDIRVLVDVAIASVEVAVQDLLKEHSGNIANLQKVLDESSSPIVKITHMKAVCDRIGLSPNSVEIDQLDVIGSLSAMQHLFLVSLYVGSGSDVALNMKIRAMHQMYQSYAEQKHVLDETITLDATKGFVEVLVNYNLMTAASGHKGNSSKFPDQVSYSLKFPAATMLKCPALAQMHKIELQKCISLRAQE